MGGLNKQGEEKNRVPDTAYDCPILRIGVMHEQPVSCQKVQVYYKDWQGNRKRKQKRGFRTKGEAKEWERDFLQQQSQGGY